eukprot:XP_001707719.1 Hypothetical protein GL50803_10704 [Giardia lamblia ATCC 50803]
MEPCQSLINKQLSVLPFCIPDGTCVQKQLVGLRSLAY